MRITEDRWRQGGIGIAVLAGVLSLAACSGGEADAPGATSADEDRQLNEAAAMLDANSVDMNAVAADTNSSESTP